MTTGERLVDLSTLLTGTAMEHFLSLSLGVAEVAFDVVLEDPHTVEVAELEVMAVELEAVDSVIVTEPGVTEVELLDTEIEVEVFERPCPEESKGLVTKDGQFLITKDGKRLLPKT